MGLLLMIAMMVVYGMFVYPLIRNLADWAGYLNDEWQVSAFRAIVIIGMFSLVGPAYPSLVVLLLNLLIIFAVDVAIHRYQPNR